MLNPLSGPRDEDESARMRRLIDEDDSDSPFWKWIFGGGCVALVAFAVLALAGWPGAGVVLVPIGLGMIIGGGIQLLLNRV
jgi:predicted phage tail protein